jgi:L-fuculose-phosphate aldolase
MTRDDVRAAIIDACRRLEAEGLVIAASGNVSVRLKPAKGRNLFAITPSAVPYRVLRPEQVLVIDFEGTVVAGDGVPSTETPTHLAAYRARPEVGAVIHTHSVYATALAVAGERIPQIVDEQPVLLGGAVRLAEYGTPGTEELGHHAADALGERQAVLLSNHGVLGVGEDLEEALAVVAVVERIAKVYTLARLLGEVRPLPPVDD